MGRAFVVTAVVLAVSLGVGILLLSGTDPEVPVSKPRHELNKVMDGLRARHPQHFAKFGLLTDAELLAVDAQERLRLHEPRGALLHPARPRFRWETPRDAVSYRLAVTGRTARVLFSKETNDAEVAWPPWQEPLAAGGRYAWRVHARTPAGQEIATQPFRVLDAATTKRYADGLAVILKEVEIGKAVVIGAHWALRFDLYLEAWNLVRKGGTGHLALLTSAWVRAKLGR